LNLTELITNALIVFVAIPVPLIVILHYITKWKQSREISRDDEQMLEDLWQLSQRLVQRIGTLERILSDELPDWRREQ